MSAALVGSVGTPVVATGSNASVGPSWGSGENRTAGNLLVCWVSGWSGSGVPSAPSGWSTVKTVSYGSPAFCSIAMFYKVAAGSDAAPTIAGVGNILTAQLAEFSGCAANTVVNQTASATSTTTASPTAACVDTAANQLVLYAGTIAYSASATRTITSTLNNGATAQDTNNGSVNIQGHYAFGYGITTGNTNPDNYTLTATSTNKAGEAAVIGSILLATAPANTVAPSISGTTTVGQQLTTASGTWTGDPTPTAAYQWNRAGTPIGSATASAYTLVNADAGNAITCTVTASNTAGSAAATTASVGPVNGPPVNTVAPSISGQTTAACVLTAASGTWTGYPTPTPAYQWARDASNISGASAGTYTLVNTDDGHAITCVITATNTSGSASATSASTALIDGPPVNSVAPTISGTTTIGQILTAGAGTWYGYPTPTYTYQWKRAGVNISGASVSTYTLVTADVSKTLTVVVTGTNADGTGSATSAATAAISDVPPRAPTTYAPVPHVGENAIVDGQTIHGLSPAKLEALLTAYLYGNGPQIVLVPIATSPVDAAPATLVPLDLSQIQAIS